MNYCKKQQKDCFQESAEDELRIPLFALEIKLKWKQQMKSNDPTECSLLRGG